MFKIPDFFLAPPLCKQAGLDLVSARRDFDPRTLVSGNLRHFDTTARCAAHYAGATLTEPFGVTLGWGRGKVRVWYSKHTWQGSRHGKARNTLDNVPESHFKFRFRNTSLTLWRFNKKKRNEEERKHTPKPLLDAV